MTRDQKVFIFKKETSTIVKYKKSLKKILHKVLSSIKIFKLLQGLVGFGNLRFAEIKSCPSTYPTCDLRKAEICNKNFWIGNDPPPVWNFSKNSSVLVGRGFPNLLS